MIISRPFAFLAALVLCPSAYAAAIGDVFLAAHPGGPRSEVVLAVEGERALVLGDDGARWIGTAELADARLHAPLRTMGLAYDRVLLPRRVVKGETTEFSQRAVQRVVADEAGRLYAVTSDASVVPLDPGTNVDPTPASRAAGPIPRAIPLAKGQSIEDGVRGYDRRFASQPDFRPVLLAPIIDFMGTYAYVDLPAFREQADARALESQTGRVATSHSR